MPDITQETIQSIIKESLGKEVAEMREEFQARGRENKKTDAEMIKDAFALMAPDRKAPELKHERGLDVARFAICMMAGSNDPAKAMHFAKRLAKHNKHYEPTIKALEKSKWIEDHDKDFTKGMIEGTIAGGGALVPQDWSDDFIPLIHDAATVGELGARDVPVPTGDLPISAGDTGVTGSWTGESQNITPSIPTTKLINLKTHKLAALVAMSLELANDTSGQAERWVRDDLVAAFAETFDLAAIRGTGALASPKGMLNQVIAANSNAQTGTTLANVTTDTTTMLYLVMAFLKKLIRGGWIMHARSWFFLFSLLGTNDMPAFRDELRAGTLFGFPFRITSQIPINLGGGTNESEVYFADFDKLMIGNTGGLTISVSDVAAYHDGSNVVSAFSRDERAIKGVTRKGFEPRYNGAEIAVLTGVTWGA